MTTVGVQKLATVTTWNGREAYDIHGLRTQLGVEILELDER